MTESNRRVAITAQDIETRLLSLKDTGTWHVRGTIESIMIEVNIGYTCTNGCFHRYKNIIHPKTVLFNPNKSTRCVGRNFEEMCDLAEFVVPWAVGLEWSEGKFARLIRDTAAEKHWDVKQLSRVFHLALLRVNPDARSPIEFDVSSEKPI